MRSLIKKCGDSASIGIPATVMAAASLNIDQVVEVREEDGRIAVEPVRAPTYVLEDLLANMSPETFPDAQGFGLPVGEEAW